MPVLWVGRGIRGPAGGLGVLEGHWEITYEKMKTVSCKEVLKTQYGLLQTTEHEFRSTGPKLIPLLAMTCLYQGDTSDWRSA